METQIQTRKKLWYFHWAQCIVPAEKNDTLDILITTNFEHEPPPTTTALTELILRVDREREREIGREKSEVGTMSTVQGDEPRHQTNYEAAKKEKNIQ
jgi:hypothetical protein